MLIRGNQSNRPSIDDQCNTDNSQPRANCLNFRQIADDAIPRALRTMIPRLSTTCSTASVDNRRKRRPTKSGFIAGRERLPLKEMGPQLRDYRESRIFERVIGHQYRNTDMAHRQCIHQATDKIGVSGYSHAIHKFAERIGMPAKLVGVCGVTECQ